ncbi:hypothetical protein Micbo1qcDRAFT_170209 [Microdochium bolleyi]|uniref:Uncharacterized protein n=1 Tax=Microdochium bolleyi TaxID=196109 RepID=A0A136JGT8_9PEZI|nr:hypothetical protein Micbo1qcDRAFT_170209 [Microdochium bolleyi]
MSLWCVRRPQCSYHKCKRTVVTAPGRPPTTCREAQSPHCKHHTCLICSRRPAGAFNEYAAACPEHVCEAQAGGQCNNLKGTPRGSPNRCERHTCNRRGCDAEVPGHDNRDHKDNFCDDHKVCPGLEGEPQGCGRPLWRYLSPGPAHAARISNYCQAHTCFAMRTDGGLQLVTEVCANASAPRALACAAHKCSVLHTNCPHPRRSRSDPSDDAADVAACLYCKAHECKRDGCTLEKYPGIDYCSQHMCLANQVWGLAPAGRWGAEYRGAMAPPDRRCNNEVQVETNVPGRTCLAFPSWWLLRLVPSTHHDEDATGHWAAKTGLTQNPREGATYTAARPVAVAACEMWKGEHIAENMHASRSRVIAHGQQR